MCGDGEDAYLILSGWAAALASTISPGQVSNAFQPCQADPVRMARERRGVLLEPGPRAGTPGLRMTHAIVTDLALQLITCITELQRIFSLWDDDEVSHGTFTLADLRKALPVVGVTAHPVDVQLLFDALDRHHYGHAAYGNLGERLAHVAGMALHHYDHLQGSDCICRAQRRRPGEKSNARVLMVPIRLSQAWWARRPRRTLGTPRCPDCRGEGATWAGTARCR